MSRTDPQVNFRMPQELRDQLEAASKANKRTLTAEIVARLQDSFIEPAEGTAISQASVGELIDEINKRYPPDYVLISIGPGASKRSDAMFDADI